MFLISWIEDIGKDKQPENLIQTVSDFPAVLRFFKNAITDILLWLDQYLSRIELNQFQS